MGNTSSTLKKTDGYQDEEKRRPCSEKNSEFRLRTSSSSSSTSCIVNAEDGEENVSMAMAMSGSGIFGVDLENEQGMDGEDEDDEDWFLTTLTSTAENSNHQNSPNDLTTTLTTSTATLDTGSEAPHHGVLAFKEAAQEQQKRKNNHHFGCVSLLQPKRPSLLWLDELHPEEEDDEYSNNEKNLNDNDAETEQLVAAQTRELVPNWNPFRGWFCNDRPSQAKNEDSRSGMLLWTTKKQNTSLSSATMTTCDSNSTTTGCSPSASSASLSNSSSWFSSSLSHDELEYTNSELELSAVEPTMESDLSEPRHVWIVTTAALPWMTGTAVNPLLRAGSLWQRYHDQVEAIQQQNNLSCENDSSCYSITLVLPWLCREKDREALYGKEWKHKTVHDQEAYIREWLSDRANLPGAARHIAIQWYTAHYHPSLSSIFAVDDVCEACQNVPADRNAVVVLEEPEHLNCYRAPGKATWGQRFCHVIGIVHTNYRAYAQSLASGLVMGPLLGAIFASLVRAYCDKVIKLSDVLQSYSPEKQVTCNVHGIRQEFLHVPPPTGNKVYFIGKLLWAKGLDKLLVLQSRYKKATGQYFPMDIYGSGPQEEEMKLAFLGNQHLRSWASSLSTATAVNNEEEDKEPFKSTSPATTTTTTKMPVEFMGRLDHASVSKDYKIFVNPSITEVLCTTTAEALAMGKFVIIPHHPSNNFFSQFPNCLQYQPHKYYEFCVLLKYALTHTPTPLSAEHQQLLTWEAATDRFIKASAVSLRDSARRERITAARQGEERFAQFHEEVCRGKSGVFVRTILHGDDPQKKTSKQPKTASDTTGGQPTG